MIVLKNMPESAPKPAPVRPAIVIKDDPAGRGRYEWMRLRDPGTNTIPDDIRHKELAFARRVNEETAGFRAKLSKTSRIKTNTWSWRGPYNVGGRTRAFAIDAANEDIFLAGGVSGGMWRSTDAGAHWYKTTDLSALHSVTCIAQDTRPGKTDTWYYGTGEIRGNSANGGGGAWYRGDGIFKSTDNGETWQVLDTTATGIPERPDNKFDYVSNLAVDVSNTSEDELYASVTYGAICRSTDGGQSWEIVLGSEANDSRFLDVAVTSTGVVYATFSSEDTQVSGISQSEDGINWTNINPSFLPSSYNRIVIDIAPSNEDIVYFLAETPGFWKYDKNSATWEDRSSNLPNFSSYQYGGTYDSQGSYNMVVSVFPQNPDIVFIGGVNLYRSTDGFLSSSNTAWIGGWLYEEEYNQHADQHVLAFLPSDPNVLFAGHDGGVTRTDNCLAADVVWMNLNNGYNTTQFYTIAIDENAPSSDQVLGGMQDNGTWRTTGQSQTADWIEELDGDGGYCYITNGGDDFYASVQNGIVYHFYFHDGVTKYRRIDPVSGTGYLFINPFAINPFNDSMVYLPAGSELWRCDDVTRIPEYQDEKAADTYWTELSAARVHSDDITALGISNTAENRLYYGTSLGKMFRIDNAQTGNPAPVDIWTGRGFPDQAYVSCIAVHPDNMDEVIVVFSNYLVRSLFHTTDGGAVWTDIGGNLEETRDGVPESGPSVRWAEIVSLNGETIYLIGASTGLYSTTTPDGFNTVWLQEGAETIGNMVVDMIAARSSDGFIAAGTHGAGVFTTTVISSIGPAEPIVPGSFELRQNYPNPFNPETTIAFSVPRTDNVTITVYDALGREINVLLNENVPAGSHRVKWNGADRSGIPVKSGVYFYTIRAAGFSAAKKMVLIR
ncbi:T9SS type A sorting domain-containing protein [candidate division KSB1 bacterium]